MKHPSLARRAAFLPTALPAAASRGTISFDSGYAFRGVLPDLTAEAAHALTRYRGQTLQYGPKVGIPELRAWIARYAAEDGIALSHDNVLVTNGAKQAIDLVCRLLLDEGDSIVVTAPTYFTAIPIFRSFGVEFIEIEQDREGLDVGELADILARRRRDGKSSPKFIYNITEFHNPTGITMSLERRKALVELAVREQIFIIEDSPYRKIRFEGDPIPPLKSLDRHDLVFHLGTFSKLMAPGLRVGWVSSSPEMIARLTQLKSDNGSCPLTQRIVFEFCNEGRLAAHTERVRETYRVHRDRMVESLRHELPDVSFDVPCGGYYMWLTLPHEMDGEQLAVRASEAGVTVLPPRKFYAHPDAGRSKNHIRIAYTHADVHEIDEGVRRLASAFRSIRAGSALATVRLGHTA